MLIAAHPRPPHRNHPFGPAAVLEWRERALDPIMAAPKNPPDYDADRFSPPTQYREADFDEIVEHVAGPELEAVEAYPFTGRRFIELAPYEEDPEA